MSEKNKLKSSIKYPTSIIIRGDDFLGVEIAKSLIEQGGYVIVIDNDVEHTIERYKDIKNQKLLTVLDFSSIEYLDEDMRRLDYVFYLGHEYTQESQEISSQDFLQSSNYLDMVIKLAHKFEAKFLLTSSIRAHQIIMNSGELDVNFGVNSQKRQAIYTQMEIQRYSEALLLEAIEKFGIDARIVRIGKIIGKYMNFDMDNSFDKLIFQAAKGEDLEIESDGLETNMYVHVLDSAYGLIKAMFTKGTNGKIFSLSNEEEITDLSIAYKLQELTGQNSEIKFVDTKRALQQIRFHKPGTNLSTIGWSPRVSFTRAISQALDYASDLLTKNRVSSSQEEENADDSTFGINNPAGNQVQEQQGALARLIAERRAQENARKGSILMAGEQARQKTKRKRELTRSEKIQRKFQAFYDSLAYKLTFLKKITIAEALFYLVLLVIFAIVYIGLISPVFVIGKNLIQMEYYKTELDKDIENEDIPKLSKDIGEMKSSLDGIIKNMKKLEIAFDIAGKDREYENTYNYFRYLNLYSTQLLEASEESMTFDAYWQNSELGLTYQPNSKSLFTLSKPEIDSENFEKIKSYDTENKVENIAIASTSLSQRSPVKLLGYDATNVVKSLQGYEKKTTEVLNMISSYNNLFFERNNSSYALIVQDNSRFTPSGGYPSTIGFVEVQNGEIVNVNLEKLDNNNNAVITTLTDSEIKEIEAGSSSIIDKNSIRLSDIFLISDRSVIEDDIVAYYDSYYGVSPDAIFFIDLETLAALLDATGPIELNQVKIEKSTLLSSINLLQGAESSKNKRNEIITNIFAAEVNIILKNKREFYKILPVIYDASLSKAAYVESSDLNIKNNLINDKGAQELEDWIYFSVIADQESASPELFPSVNLKVSDLVNKDLSIRRSVEFTQGSAQDVERVVICIEPGSKEFDLSKSEVPLGQVFFDDKSCITADFDEDKAIIFSYEVSKGIENLSGAEYNKSLGLISSPGLDVVYDYEAGLSPEYSIVEEGDIIISNQKVIETGTFEGEKNLIFKFRE